MTPYIHLSRSFSVRHAAPLLEDPPERWLGEPQRPTDLAELYRRRGLGPGLIYSKSRPTPQEQRAMRAVAEQVPMDESLVPSPPPDSRVHPEAAVNWLEDLLAGVWESGRYTPEGARTLAWALRQVGQGLAERPGGAPDELDRRFYEALVWTVRRAPAHGAQDEASAGFSRVAKDSVVPPLCEDSRALRAYLRSLSRAFGRRRSATPPRPVQAVLTPPAPDDKLERMLRETFAEFSCRGMASEEEVRACLEALLVEWEGMEGAGVDRAVMLELGRAVLLRTFRLAEGPSPFAAAVRRLLNEFVWLRAGALPLREIFEGAPDWATELYWQVVQPEPPLALDAAWETVDPSLGLLPARADVEFRGGLADLREFEKLRVLGPRAFLAAGLRTPAMCFGHVLEFRTRLQQMVAIPGYVEQRREQLVFFIREVLHRLASAAQDGSPGCRPVRDAMSAALFAQGEASADAVNELLAQVIAEDPVLAASLGWLMGG